MDIAADPTAALGPLSGNAGSKAGIAENFDTFLKLLTTQMQNQDPLEPLDSSKFTEQLVQFSNVEQGIRTNDNLELMIGMMLAGQASAAVNYIGKMVATSTNQAVLENGQAEWNYELPASVAEATITITDASGKLVYTGPAETAAGRHSFSWDGTDNSGDSLPDGQYRLSVAARDAEGDEILVAVSVNGRVSGTEVKDGETYLIVGGQSVPLSKVRKVTEAPAA